MRIVKRLLHLPRYVYLAVVALVVALIILFVWNQQDKSNDAKWTKATEYFTKADYENANKELKSLDVPDSVERLRVYSQTKLAVRDLPAALIGYQKLYKADKSDSYALIIGNIFNEQKNYDAAAKTYRE